MKEFLQKEGQRTRICPNPDCLQPSTKDDKCEHVTCTYCKLDWCFYCSALRSPIITHGNHYHRECCKDYKPWLDEKGNDVVGDKVEKNCLECRRLGKLCERPKLTMKEFYEQNKATKYLETEIIKEKHN